MARYTGPKHKIARREGVNVLEKTSASLDRRLNVIPGGQSKKGRRKYSEYGIQLREKQKLKKIYGVLEKQFRKYAIIAQSKKENTIETLIGLLETRLDNVVYRLGYSKSRYQSRQFVSHNHIFVNGKKLNIPSYSVKPGDIISLSPLLLKQDELKERVEDESNILPYLEKNKSQGKLLRLPQREEVANPVDYQLVIEFYSR